MLLLARLVAIVALACAGTGCVKAAQTETGAEIEASASRATASVEPRLVAYKTTPARVLYLHVFAPDPQRFPGVRPAALVIHGGGWKEGNPRRFYDQARHLADNGMVAIAPEYRIQSRDRTGPEMALRDAKSAMRYVRAHAAELRLDPDRIVAVGGSAGGHLAAALATIDGFNELSDDLAIATRPTALVLYNPVIDNGPGGYGHDRVQDHWQGFSPMHNIAPGHPSSLILLGTRDELVPVETGKRYCEKVRAAGSDCTLHLYEGQPHAFYNRARSERYYRETTEAMDTFLMSLGYY